MVRGVHALFYSSQPAELRALLRDKLGRRESRAFTHGSETNGQAFRGQ